MSKISSIVLIGTVVWCSVVVGLILRQTYKTEPVDKWEEIEEWAQKNQFEYKKGLSGWNWYKQRPTTLQKAAVWPRALTAEEVKQISAKDEILAGFACLTLAIRNLPEKGELIYQTMELNGKYRMVFRQGDVGIEDDKILRGLIIDMIEVKGK